jgi:hypothetical protein
MLTDDGILVAAYWFISGFIENEQKLI